MTEKEIKKSISLFLQPSTSHFNGEWKNLAVDVSYHFYKIERLINEFCDGDKNKIEIMRKGIFESLNPEDGKWAILVELVKSKDKGVTN